MNAAEHWMSTPRQHIPAAGGFEEETSETQVFYYRKIVESLDEGEVEDDTFHFSIGYCMIALDEGHRG